MSRHDERGLATMVAAAGLLVLAAGFAALIAALTWQINAHRVQGAADLVAVTAAQAENVGTSSPCAAASRAASAEHVDLLSCHVGGGALSFVVTVTVRGGTGIAMVSLPITSDATAHAGVTMP